ncbi:hypothetical protein J1N35_040598 [Gossypium stocksii]|uniref:Aminotransferase-like plant mobile domain-containing protein n=1 Tax=Gossypium stocksii TaxID=47602 RepID=A0A9D3UE83_9ROSI|nr:hypothetical protein J1N35_040598 [Gossypium stocksii]
MSINRVLQCYIHNMSGPPSPLIENYLWEAGCWHVATIGRGCKLDPKLISALIERAAAEFSWGSAVLAILYKEMCGATQLNKAKIGGCRSLLQSWA